MKEKLNKFQSWSLVEIIKKWDKRLESEWVMMQTIYDVRVILK